MEYIQLWEWLSGVPLVEGSDEVWIGMEFTLPNTVSVQDSASCHSSSSGISEDLEELGAATLARDQAPYSDG